MPHRYVSNRNESVRMFESDFMEFFSHVHPATPLVIYLPLMAGMFYLALAGRGQPLGLVASLFAAGVLIWSFVEYSMHRWVFHLRHHYQDDETGYGVTSPLWDHVFGTKAARDAGRAPGSDGAPAKP